MDEASYFSFSGKSSIALIEIYVMSYLYVGCFLFDSFDTSDNVMALLCIAPSSKHGTTLMKTALQISI